MSGHHPSSEHRAPHRGGLADRLSGLLVALVLMLNLAPALAAPVSPVLLGSAGGCSATSVTPDAPADCCCERPAEPASCCTPVLDCGCMTRPTPAPAEDGLLPAALLTTASDVGHQLDVALDRAAAVPAVDATPADLTAAGTASPPATAAPPPGGTAGRLGLLRGCAARLAFLATLLR